MLFRRSLLALSVTLGVAYAWGPRDDGFRAACADVPLDHSLCTARMVLEPTGARYRGYVDDEHRWANQGRFCAVRTGDDNAIVQVRYVAPMASVRAP